MFGPLAGSLVFGACGTGASPKPEKPPSNRNSQGGISFINTKFRFSKKNSDIPQTDLIPDRLIVP